jgi:hypothetical protein
MGAFSLAEALRINVNLKKLSLESNCVGVEGTTALAKALQFNPTLSHLVIKFCRDYNLTTAQILLDATICNKVDSRADMETLLTTLIGYEGATFLAMQYPMTFSALQSYSVFD